MSSDETKTYPYPGAAWQAEADRLREILAECGPSQAALAQTIIRLRAERDAAKAKLAKLDDWLQSREAVEELALRLCRCSTPHPAVGCPMAIEALGAVCIGFADLDRRAALSGGVTEVEPAASGIGETEPGERI